MTTLLFVGAIVVLLLTMTGKCAAVIIVVITASFFSKYGSFYTYIYIFVYVCVHRVVNVTLLSFSLFQYFVFYISFVVVAFVNDYKRYYFLLLTTFLLKTTFVV